MNMIKQNGWQLCLCFLAAAALMIVPNMAHAGQAIADVLCNVVDWFTGPMGKAIATIAIIIIGVGALMGKVSWGMAIIVAIGVAVIFGASTIVGELSDTGSGACGGGGGGTGTGGNNDDPV